MSYLDKYGRRKEVAVLDYFAMANHGMVDGHKTVSKFGANLEFQAEETLWSAGGVFDPSAITGAETLTVVSTSVQDINTSGTGAWLVAIFGLDADYNEISELTLALNGTTSVTSVNSYIAVNRCAVSYSGSSDFNVGTISFTQSSSGIKLAEIPIGESITLQCIYTVPAGYSGYLQGLYLSGAKTGGGTQPVLEFETYSYNPSSQTKYIVGTTYLDVSVSNGEFVPQLTASPSSEKVTIYLNVSSSAAASKAFGRFFMVLIENK
jgi:hypothetical protein